MTKKVVVDGSNVAFEEQSQGGKPKVSNLVAIREYLKERGFDPTVIVDANLYHIIDDPDQLDSMINKEQIHQAPAGTEADYWVLETADRMGALVVSNDRFDPYQDRHGWIKERRIPYMIIDGVVELHEPSLKKHEQSREKS